MHSLSKRIARKTRTFQQSRLRIESKRELSSGDSDTEQRAARYTRTDLRIRGPPSRRKSQELVRNLGLTHVHASTVEPSNALNLERGPEVVSQKSKFRVLLNPHLDTEQEIARNEGLVEWVQISMCELRVREPEGRGQRRSFFFFLFFFFLNMSLDASFAAVGGGLSRWPHAKCAFRPLPSCTPPPSPSSSPPSPSPSSRQRRASRRRRVRGSRSLLPLEPPEPACPLTAHQTDRDCHSLWLGHLRQRRRPHPTSTGDSLLPLEASLLVPTWKEWWVTVASAAAIHSCSCRHERGRRCHRVATAAFHRPWRPLRFGANTCVARSPLVRNRF